MSAQLALDVVEIGVAAAGRPALIRALTGQLWSLRDTIVELTTERFAAPQGRASGSVGGHVRHCLDHVRALVTARNGVELTYDARLRGTRVETDPSAAIAELDRLVFALDTITAAALQEPVRLATLIDGGGSVVRIASTLGREVAFVLQHTIHHCAIVAVLLERHGIAAAAGFGYAPSTPVRH